MQIILLLKLVHPTKGEPSEQVGYYNFVCITVSAITLSNGL